ncbi:DUF4269 domain-containing protein [Brevibacillus ginsengisoli]|uniref:DUF4269 domain-containing protein n=1 Tax=Brevibacillus ginsengisoli TaxID=363854 RepID=UPI003CEFD8FB
MLPNWFDPTYLLAGDSGQQRAYHVLQELRILEVLKEFTPVLTGTFPLQLQVENSDLDIICEMHDVEQFTKTLETEFGQMPDIILREVEVSGQPTVIANFTYQNMPIEIFGQAVPVTKQNAYRHMVIEARLLELAKNTLELGNQAWSAIRQLKQDGLKTEPAFAHYFGLPCINPYEELLLLEPLSGEQLHDTIATQI